MTTPLAVAHKAADLLPWTRSSVVKTPTAAAVPLHNPRATAITALTRGRMRITDAETSAGNQIITKNGNSGAKGEAPGVMTLPGPSVAMNTAPSKAVASRASAGRMRIRIMKGREAASIMKGAGKDAVTKRKTSKSVEAMAVAANMPARILSPVAVNMGDSNARTNTNAVAMAALAARDAATAGRVGGDLLRRTRNAAMRLARAREKLPRTHNSAMNVGISQSTEALIDAEQAGTGLLRGDVDPG